MTYVWAHRGASGYAPENTLEAFALADKMKADGIELDVHLSKDGEIIVTHDENVQRVTCGVDAMVKDLTLAELKKLDVYNGIEGYRNVRIPTLPEVLDFLKTNNLYLNIELKTGIVLYDGIEQKTIDAVRAAGLQDRVIYSSFNHYSLMLVRQIDPEARIGLLYSEALIEPHAYAQRIHANAIHPFYPTLMVPGTGRRLPEKRHRNQPLDGQRRAGHEAAQIGRLPRADHQLPGRLPQCRRRGLINF